MTLDMKEAHGRLQDLAETGRCFMASIKLNSEFNNSLCVYLTSNSHSDFDHLYLCTECHVTHRLRKAGFGGIRNGNEMAMKKIGEKSKEYMRLSMWDKLQKASNGQAQISTEI